MVIGLFSTCPGRIYPLVCKQMSSDPQSAKQWLGRLSSVVVRFDIESPYSNKSSRYLVYAPSRKLTDKDRAFSASEMESFELPFVFQGTKTTLGLFSSAMDPDNVQEQDALMRVKYVLSYRLKLSVV